MKFYDKYRTQYSIVIIFHSFKNLPTTLWLESLTESFSMDSILQRARSSE